MGNYKLAFVGMGSIGQRHLRNTCKYLKGQNHSYSIDLYRSSKKHPLEADVVEMLDKEFFLSDGVPSDKIYDAVFVTNPTYAHYETVKAFLPSTKAMFIEKPVFDRTDVDIEAIGDLESTICYVACPLRYNAVINYIRNNVDCSSAYSVRALSSSYLPDWRPGIDYRQCYSAHRNMGGGVGIDLIHEWDYLTWLFGTPRKGFSIHEKVSNLEIDSDDIAIYIALTQNTAIELHLDYFGRKSIRKMQIFMPDDTIDCDILNGSIYYLRSGTQTVLDNSRDNFQMKEIIHFFDIINGKCENDSTIQDALKVLHYARGEF